MNQGDSEMKDHYEAAKVLIILWDNVIVKDPALVAEACSNPSILLSLYSSIGKQLAALYRLFTDHFRYKVTSADMRRDSEHLMEDQLADHVSTFVRDEDGPNTLLIVYYIDFRRYDKHRWGGLLHSE